MTLIQESLLNSHTCQTGNFCRIFQLSCVVYPSLLDFAMLTSHAWPIERERQSSADLRRRVFYRRLVDSVLSFTSNRADRFVCFTVRWSRCCTESVRYLAGPVAHAGPHATAHPRISTSGWSPRWTTWWRCDFTSNSGSNTVARVDSIVDRIPVFVTCWKFTYRVWRITEYVATANWFACHDSSVVYRQ